MERELVIVDDCFTDGTSEILTRLATVFPQIRLYRLFDAVGTAAPLPRLHVGKVEDTAQNAYFEGLGNMARR